MDRLEALCLKQNDLSRTAEINSSLDACIFENSDGAARAAKDSLDAPTTLERQSITGAVLERDGKEESRSCFRTEEVYPDRTSLVMLKMALVTAGFHGCFGHEHHW